MQVGLTEAAELTGKNPSTLTRAVNAGKLSATQAPDGTRTFMIAELERWAGKLRTPGEPRTDALEVQRTDVHDALEEARAGQIASLEREIRRLEETVEETRKERDHWRQHAEGAQRLLTFQTEKGTELASGQGRGSRYPGLLARLFGRTA